MNLPPDHAKVVVSRHLLPGGLGKISPKSLKNVLIRNPAGPELSIQKMRFSYVNHLEDSVVLPAFPVSFYNGQDSKYI
jgi:hypothetical protein